MVKDPETSEADGPPGRKNHGAEITDEVHPELFQHIKLNMLVYCQY